MSLYLGRSTCVTRFVATRHISVTGFEDLLRFLEFDFSSSDAELGKQYVFDVDFAAVVLEWLPVSNGFVVMQHVSMLTSWSLSSNVEQVVGSERDFRLLFRFIEVHFLEELCDSMELGEIFRWQISGKCGFSASIMRNKFSARRC